MSARPGLRLSEGDPKLRPQGGYAVQVGAYHDPELARRAAYDVARKVPKILLKGNVDISRLDRGRKPVYRARIVGFSRAEADEACRLLARKRQDCLVLRTGPLQVAQNG